MLLIINGKILCPNEIVENGAVYVEKGVIMEISTTAHLKKKYPTARIVDAKGGLVMPGLTNCHMHLYSTFARGMFLQGPAPKNFIEILNGLWWRLDKQLNEEDIYYSALVPLIECVKFGTTTMIDHHASPGFVRGSLSAIRQALAAVPVRASLSYEVSDRDGIKVSAEGIEENVWFIEENLGNDMVTGLFGMHASFTISDETLDECVKVASKLNCGFHVHTAEGIADVEDAKKKYGMGVVDRWNEHGVLGPKTLLAHCIHISDREMDLIAKTRTNVVHNPESNMNNAVGAANIVKMIEKGVLVGLGTDGMTSDMFQESKFAHLIRKHVEEDPRVGFTQAGQLLLENNYKILSNYFSKPIGKIEKGAFADIIILDYDPPTPLSLANFLGHFLYGMNSSYVATTIVNGKVLMEDRKLVDIDEEKIYARSRELAEKLWKRL